MGDAPTRVAVIGAGISGLAAALELRATASPPEVIVLEGSHRVGGLVETELAAPGYLLEHGPDSLVTHDPAGIGLVRALGMEGDIVVGEGPRHAFIVSNGRLVAFPPGLLAMTPRAALGLLRSPLLGPLAKARLLLEPLVPRGPGDDDESVAAFFTRRFGRQTSERLVDPLLRGIYATDTSDLSMRAAMPRLHEIERRFGSVGLGVALARAGRSEALPGAVSLRDGMAQLTDAMARAVGHVRLDAEVSSIERAPRGRIAIDFRDGARLVVDGVVLAVPAFVEARLLEAWDQDLASQLGGIEYAPHLSISMGFATDEIPHDMRGTGFIVPRDEERSITACSWSSRKWPGRAPAGREVLRVFSRMSDASDEEAIELARRDLRDLMGIGVEVSPALLRVRRGARVLARRALGHLDRVESIRQRARQTGRLTLAGNALGVVGLSACIESARRAAADLMPPAGARERPASDV